MIAWCNGSLVDPEAPAVSVLDHGFTVGDGVFEAIKVVENRPFALTRHLARLARSARGLGLPDPDAARIRGAIDEVLEGQHISWGRIRITFTAGISPLGSNRVPTQPTLVVVVTEAQPYPPTTKVVTVPWPRNERGALAGLKTTAYAENVVALAYAAERGGSEAIFANIAGNLCEGTGANVFCVFEGQIVTPPLSCGCLAGITRELIIEWCDVQERDITMAEFARADEVFLASTTRDVQAVSHVDERQLGDSPITAKVADIWRTNEPQNVDP
ncbi:MAG: aminodeoxychorismate lyase [Nocardioidaceae bacterium]|nr:aminodeoxychorismate lyase [Nocardioidaceae bacterium]